MKVYVIHLAYRFAWTIPGKPPVTGREDWRRYYIIRTTDIDVAIDLATHTVAAEVKRQHVMPAGHTSPVPLATSDHESELLFSAIAHHEDVICMRLMPASRGWRVDKLRQIVDTKSAAMIDDHNVGVLDAVQVLHSFDTAARLCEWIAAGDIENVVTRCHQATEEKREADRSKDAR